MTKATWVALPALFLCLDRDGHHQFTNSQPMSLQDPGRDASRQGKGVIRRQRVPHESPCREQHRAPFPPVPRDDQVSGSCEFHKDLFRPKHPRSVSRNRARIQSLHSVSFDSTKFHFWPQYPRSVKALSARSSTPGNFMTPSDHSSFQSKTQAES